MKLRFLTGLQKMNQTLIEPRSHLSRAALHRWTKVHELLIEQRIRRDMLAQAVKESSAMLRYALRSNVILTKTLYLQRGKFIPLSYTKKVL